MPKRVTEGPKHPNLKTTHPMPKRPPTDADVSGAEEGLDAETPDASIPTEDSNTSDEEEDTTDSGTEEDDSSIPVEDVSDNPVEDAFQPGEAGSFPVEVEVVEWQVTPLSSGPIDVHTYLPQEKDLFPCWFAPGFQLAGQNFDWVGQFAASHGYVVLIPTFGDSILAAIDHADLAMALRSMVDIATGVDSPLSVPVDSNLVALGGHSRGGSCDTCSDSGLPSRSGFRHGSGGHRWRARSRPSPQTPASPRN